MRSVEEGMESPETSTAGIQPTESKVNSLCITHFCIVSNPSTARYVYGLIFLVTNLLAWMVRDYGRAALSELRRLEGCHGAKDCLGAEGVLRISLGCFIFFFVMFLSTMGTKKLVDKRNSWHSSWWSIKIVLWTALMVISFSIPSRYILLYGMIAHLGAGIFLFIQLISVISLLKWLNEWCRSGNNVERCHVQVVALSSAAYVASFVGIILMYVWYAPRPTCSINIFFITLTLALIQITTFVSAHPKVKGGFLTPGLMGVYIVFLCWCGIRSEPPMESCNKKAEAATHSDAVAIISFIVAILAIVIATFTTGTDSNCFQYLQFKNVKVESEDDVAYGYGFFHFVFAMGGTYFAMLFIGWNTNHTIHKWTIDVGWASTWVRIANEWLAALVYLWMMIAPLVWKTTNIFGTS